MKAIRKIIATPTLLALTDQAVCSGTNFLLILFLAQRLSISHFGIYASVLLIVYLIMSVNNAIVIQPFQVFISKIESPKGYLTALLIGEILFLTALAILLRSIMWLLPASLFLFQDYFALAVFTGGFIINDFFRKILLGIAETKIAIAVDILFLLLLAFMALKKQWDLNEILYGIGWANLIALTPALSYFAKNCQKPTHWKTYWQKHVAEGKWLLSTAVLQWCSSNFFVLVSGIYIGVQALGVLRLVQSFFGIINVGLQVVENYFLPKIARMYNEDRILAKKQLRAMSVNGAWIMGILLLLLFMFSSPIIIAIGGAQYQEYGYVVKIMSVLYFFIFLGYPVRIAIRIQLLNRIFFLGYGFSFLTSVLTFHFLLKFWGLSGAISGLVINQLTMILYWQYQLGKKQFQLWK
ncbi:lipopolysaccharide biosynthesis protein [Pedobacter helvus]|uniref:Lipopolysaccharide biosynthesis protein n=1 Tax=Pedobacter helvus TaxID=2563444 RepID=A0ABW9JKR0_9SPHI|nr:hypothetical protein [Pedobacter ureilyticus]